jgi:hypothetical protein
MLDREEVDMLKRSFETVKDFKKHTFAVSLLLPIIMVMS